MHFFFTSSSLVDMAAAHKIMRRDVGSTYRAMRKIHYNGIRFRDTLALDEAEARWGRSWR
jgi:hypothetical protein